MRERDYKREYERRVELGRQRGVSRAAARGHKSSVYESEQRKTRAERPLNRLRYWEARTRFDIDRETYRVIVESAVQRTSVEHVIGILKRKYESARDFMVRVDEGLGYTEGSANSEAARGSLGQGRYYAFKKREGFLPVELFWYHGYY